MPSRVNVHPTLVVPLEVQTAGGDRTKKILKRRKCDAGLVRLGKAWALSPDDIRLEDRGPSVGIRHNRLTQATTPGWKIQDIGVTLRSSCRATTGNRQRPYEGTAQQAATFIIDTVLGNGRNKLAGQKVLRRLLELAPSAHCI